MRTTLCALIALLTATSHLWAQPASKLGPTARDLEPPVQDLETLKGEIVWLQAVLLRGDPTPYRDPRMPLAAYEQGILDEEGKMWTILDTPKGRELRYNPDLRGQRIEVRRVPILLPVLESASGFGLRRGVARNEDLAGRNPFFATAAVAASQK